MKEIIKCKTNYLAPVVPPVIAPADHMVTGGELIHEVASGKLIPQKRCSQWKHVNATAALTQGRKKSTPAASAQAARSTSPSEQPAKKRRRSTHKGIVPEVKKVLEEYITQGFFFPQCI